MLKQHAMNHLDRVMFPPNRGRDYNVIRGKYTKRAYGMLGQSWQNAEDAVQETYLKLLEHPPYEGITEDEYEKLFTIVLDRVIYNMGRNEKAKERNHIRDEEKFVQYLETDFDEENEDEIISLADVGSNPEDVSVFSETIKVITAEVDKLKFAHRQIAAMGVLYEYKPKEIAAITGYSKENVWKILQRFRQHLTEVLECA